MIILITINIIEGIEKDTDDLKQIHSIRGNLHQFMYENEIIKIGNKRKDYYEWTNYKKRHIIKRLITIINLTKKLYLV